MKIGLLAFLLALKDGSCFLSFGQGPIEFSTNFFFIFLGKILFFEIYPNRFGDIRV